LEAQTLLDGVDARYKELSDDDKRRYAATQENPQSSADSPLDRIHTLSAQARQLEFFADEDAKRPPPTSACRDCSPRASS
jgi:hypothetical protein